MNISIEQIKTRLARPVDGASLAVLRICFGVILLWHMLKQFQVRGGRNFIDFFYNEPAFHFPYYGFEWVKPVPEPFLSLVFVAAVVATLFVAIGFLYRISAVSFFLLYTYTFLIDQAEYNNHYYLVCILAFLLAIMPAQRRYSVDAWLAARRQPESKNKSRAAPLLTVPFWTVFILRFEVFLVYFFSGLAKTTPEWLSGIPIQSAGAKLRIMLDQFGVVPEFVTDLHAGLFLAWGAMLFDIIVGFLLLWKPTRWLGIVCAFVFNVHNHFIFPIGIFPFLAFAIVLIFLPPDWPVQFWDRLKHWKSRVLKEKKARKSKKILAKKSKKRTTDIAILPNATWAFIVFWVVTQSLIPLRHYLIPGDANWTEEGQKFSWRMMLRMKTAGHIIFYVKDPELQKTDDQGHPQMDWSKWPKSAPRAIFVPIVSQRFDWATHEGLTLTYEPLNGYRVIYNQPGDGDLQQEQAIQEIKDIWKKKFSRLPDIHRAIPLREALNMMAEQILAVGNSRDTKLIKAGSIIHDLKLIASQLENLNKQVWNQQAKHLSEAVNLLGGLQTSDFGDLVAPIIPRIAPFAIQGGAPSKKTLLIVSDPQIKANHVDSTFRKLSGDDSYIVWLDIKRLRPQAWRGLPKTLITFDRGKLRFVWNHFKDLNHFQLKRFSIRPHMIYEYAKSKIAVDWQREFGRRPAVYVSSLVMLNYKDPRPLIDPDVDLASASFTVFGTNTWILPRFDP